LDIAFLSSVKNITSQKEYWEVERTMDAWEENWQVASPMAVTIDPRAYASRPVGLVGISRVYDEPAIEQWCLTDLGLKMEEVGLMGSPTRVAALEQIKRNRKCDMLEGEPQEQVAELMARLTRTGAVD
jgi:electron transfer flavoprotein beta subunit